MPQDDHEYHSRLDPVHRLFRLDADGEAALKFIVTHPKSALVKQYQRLFEMEGATSLWQR